MSPILRNTLISLSLAGLLSGSLFALTTSPTDVGAKRQVAPRAERIVRSKPRLEEKRPEKKAIHGEPADHGHGHHQHIDLSGPFDPKQLATSHHEPEGMSADDRDEWLVLLENAQTFLDRRKAMLSLSSLVKTDKEVEAVFHQELRRESNEKLQAHLIRVLAPTGGEDLAVELESIALGSGSDFIKRRALLAMKEFPPEVAFTSVLTVAEQGDWNVRTRAIQLLAQQFPEEPEVESLVASLE